MTMRRHDLNLLPVLDALLRHRNVTRAGQELGLSQSATSHALTRLRDHFGDRLLNQAGNELLLTHRAESMAAQIDAIMQMLDRLLETESFDPATALRRFKLGTADYITQLVLPGLTRTVNKVAPRVSIQVTWDHDNTAAKLRNGHLDLALRPRGTIDAADLHTECLFSDELVVIAAGDHPDIGETLDLGTFLRLPHASFRRENAPEKSFAEQQLAQNNLRPPEAVLVSDFLPLAFIVAGTQCTSLIPKRVATQLQATANLRLFEPPFPVERLSIHAYWSHEAHGDAAHRWFREQVQSTCAAL